VAGPAIGEAPPGPVWHVSISARGLLAARPVLEREAERQLVGVGDPERGEWRDFGGRFFHLRRRLTAGEERRTGPVADIRRTPEAVLRAGRIGPLLAFAPAEVVASEIGTAAR
jgi:hypothetical protein